MTRQDIIKQAAADYTRRTRPMAIGGDKFKDKVDSINANPDFIAGAEWADKYLNYESEVMFRLPNGNIEICTIEKLITMHNNLLLIVESRTVAGAFRRLDKAVRDWKDSVRGSLSSLTTRFIRKTNNETAE